MTTVPPIVPESRPIVLLDSAPLGMITNPRVTAANAACSRWLDSLLLRGVEIAIPEIVDFEVRRELIRSNKWPGIARLDAYCNTLRYLPLTTTAMRQAALFCAQARQRGRPTAGDQALDGDVILAAQAAVLGEPDAVIATTNVGHLAQFVRAELWADVG